MQYTTGRHDIQQSDRKYKSNKSTLFVGKDVVKGQGQNVSDYKSLLKRHFQKKIIHPFEEEKTLPPSNRLKFWVYIYFHAFFSLMSEVFSLDVVVGG